MNSTEALRNYKHDISGKFKDISLALSSIDENSFTDPEGIEIFHAVHEVILKMVRSSRKTILNKLNQEMALVVTDKEVDLKLSKLQMEGLIVRYEMSSDLMKYIYFKAENEGPVEVQVEILKTLLPIKEVRFEDEEKK